MPSLEQVKWLLELLLAPMNSTRQRRKFIEAEWLLNYRAWQGWPSQSYTLPLPDGAVHYFIPHARRAVERNVSRITKLQLPQSEWFQVLPNDEESFDTAESVQAVFNFIYSKKIKTKRLVSSLSRCLFLYDFAVISTSLKIENDLVWPYHRDVDPFNFYIFPDTAATLEEALFIFEDRIIPLQVYNSLVNINNSSQSLYKPLKSSDLTAPEWPYHLIERIAYRGLSNPSDFVQGTGNYQKLSGAAIETAKQHTQNSLINQSRAFVSLSKVHFRVGSKWFLCEICNNLRYPEIVRLDEMESIPLYRWSTVRTLPGELYTNAPMDDIRVLQNLTNTAMSQVEANRSIITEPPMAVDTSMVGRIEPYFFQNRRWWKVPGNPNEIMKQLDVRDTTSEGIRAWQIYLAQINSLAGAGTIAEGQPGRNMPRAGFAVDSLINLALTDLEDTARSMEDELLTPALSDAYYILNKYIPDDQIMKIPGRASQLPKSYRVDDLYGDFTFSWIGALGFQDINTRANKFLQFLQVASNPAVQQSLAQQGLQLDLAQVIKTIYVYGLGERGLSNIIKPIPQEQLKQQAQNIQQQQTQQEAILQSQLQSTQSKSEAETLKAQAAMLKVKGDLATTLSSQDLQNLQFIFSQQQGVESNEEDEVQE
jgi:hypothetical protein